MKWDLFKVGCDMTQSIQSGKNKTKSILKFLKFSNNGFVDPK